MSFFGSGITVTIEAQFSAGVWTDITADVLPPTAFDWGINGIGANDRVASAGTLTFALDNSYQNSGKAAGYYTPGHASCRSGFDIGVALRASYTATGVTKYYKWYGFIAEIEPLSAPDEIRTLIRAADWFDVAATALVPGLSVQTLLRSDQLFTLLTGLMSNPPAATSVQAGEEIFPTALDTASADSVYVLGELQKLANSEVGYCFAKGSSATPGLIVWESRRTRGQYSAPVAAYTTMNVLKPSRNRDKLNTRVQVKSHPRRIDTTAVVIFTLLDVPLIPQKTSYGPINCLYKDNMQNRVRIGASSQQALVANTDYKFNTSAAGTGTDISANLLISITHYGSHSVATITNNGIVDGYLTLFQIRGFGYYDEGEVTFEAADSVNQAKYGDRPLVFQMPYQSDTTVSSELATLLLKTYDVVVTYPQVFSFIVVDQATLLQAVNREISDRITITDTLSGISADFFINHIRHINTAEGVLTVEFVLAPATGSIQRWKLDDTTYSVLGTTTILDFGLWRMHWVLEDAAFGLLGSTTTLQ